ncbi:MAG TPA: CPBP family intramembrane glutamic endopeptidase [Solirubrobacteraceae bacterium]|nr:CPBP family intramembrane glutamic endopeptidase [Solirubrobacteraceae bacterium]
MTSIPPPDYDAPAEPEPEPARAPADEPQRGTPTVARPTGRASWRPWTAWGAILTGFSLTIFGGIIVAIVTAAIGESASDPSPGVTIGLTIFQNLSLIAAALLFALIAGRPAGADFGLRRTPIGRAIGLMLAVAVAFVFFSLAWGIALQLDDKQTLPEELGIDGSTLNLVLAVVMITVIAPLGEELFFRGFFFGALRNWRGWLPAAVVTGLVFGLIHAGSTPIGYTVPLAFFGFGLCVLYERTGSLYPGIALHALNNSVALGLTQKWTWEILPTMVGAVLASLAIAALLARILDARASSALAPAS